MTQLTQPQIRLEDPDFFADGIPHDVFTYLRREHPVYWHPQENGTGFWCVTKAEDVSRISRDPQTFSSAVGGVFIEESAVLPLEILQESLLIMDPPRHTRLRRIVSRRFTPRRIASLEPRIRELTRTLLDDVCERGACDLVADIAVELPLQMIAELLGVPHEDRQLVFDWSNKMVGFDDPAFRGSYDDALIAFEESLIYANELAEKRLEEPADDLITALVQADMEGERLSELELATFFLLLATAGNETTRNTISLGMLALMEHPDERQKLLDDPSLIPNAVEEILRWTTVVLHFRRTAMRDVELRGQTIREGDKVVVWYISANRDEDVFEDPFRFDVTRQFHEQHAFGGGGPHYCLGAPLARLQLRVLFEELLRSMPDVALGGPVEKLRSNWFHGLKRMPVTFTPTAAVG